MPSGSVTELEAKIPKSPEDRPIPAEGYCALCLYNIPRGTIMIVLPGVIMLLCGTLTLIVTETGVVYGNNPMTALAILIPGAIITVVGVIYCLKMWCKYKPKRRKQQTSLSSRHDPVSLVAVYKIRNEGQDNPSFVPDSHSQVPSKPQPPQQQPAEQTINEQAVSHQRSDKQTIGQAGELTTSSETSGVTRLEVADESGRIRPPSYSRAIMMDEITESDNRVTDSASVDQPEKNSVTTSRPDGSERTTHSDVITDKPAQKDSSSHCDVETTFSNESEISYRDVESRETQYSEVI